VRWPLLLSRRKYFLEGKLGMPQPRDIIMRVGVGEVYAVLVSEGSAWQPDVANDMVNRLHDVWRNTLDSAVDAGVIDVGPLQRDVEDEELLAEIDDLFFDSEVGEDG